ncbi:CGP-CTERM sorting domain-containing protein [Thermococcus sp. AM4]|uniref:CGP-CTERM sorting domain-containing protein n=1 Tax=Thermococcus sp. (strain AM4) TaxID=246969 RepID=UPI0001870F47|nr:CGP-CTERM sorting domain-containing protein [Thermococcus sp. AM4]EEB74117.1 hypothetical protein TAM4_1484 [Thermococcus sp. AM4]
MRRPLALLLLIFLAGQVYGAHFDGWIRGYLGREWASGEYVLPLGDGIVVIGTTTDTPSGRWGVFVMKLDRDGNIKWSKVWQAGGDVNGITGAAVDSRGRLYIAGVVIDGRSKKDGFIIAFSSDGRMLWQKIIGTDKDDFLSSIAVGNDGLYAGGLSKGLEFRTGTVASAFLVKFDASGNPVWVKAYENGYYTAFNSVTVLGNRVFALGRIAIPGECDVQRARLWLVRLSSGGDVELQETSRALSVKTLLSFNGSLIGAAGSIVFMMDREGNVKWARRLKVHIYSVSASSEGLAITTDEGELLLLSPDGEPLRGVKLSFYPYTTGESIANAVWLDDRVLAVGTYLIPGSEQGDYDRLLVMSLPSNFPYGNMIRPLGDIESSPVELENLGAPEVEERNAKDLLKVRDGNGTVSEWAPETVWIYPWARLEVIIPSFGAFVKLRGKHYSADFVIDHSSNLTVLPDTYNISVTPQIQGDFKLREFNTTAPINPGDELVLYVDFEKGMAYLERSGGNATSSGASESTASTTASSITTSTVRQGGTSSTSSKKPAKSGGICGPGIIALFAFLPLLRRR